MSDNTQQHPGDMGIQDHLAVARAKIRTEMMGRIDTSVFVLDLVDLALEMCQGLMRNEVTGAVPMLIEQLEELLGGEQGPEADQGPPPPTPLKRISAA